MTQLKKRNRDFVYETSTYEKPTNEKPTNEKPTNETSTNEKPTNEKPSKKARRELDYVEHETPNYAFTFLYFVVLGFTCVMFSYAVILAVV